MVHLLADLKFRRANDQHGAIDFTEIELGIVVWPASSAVRTGSRPAMCRVSYLTSRNQVRRLTSELRKERSSTHSSAIDPPLSPRMMTASCSLQNYFASNTNHAHPQINLFGASGLMKQSAMVHKRPPAAGDSPTAAA
jgi:hypothetical protein